jgi:hypothetical protein
MRTHFVQITSETGIDIVLAYGFQLIDDGLRFAVFADLPLVRYLLIDDDLAFHASMADTASMAAPKRVRAGRLRQEFNRSCLTLFELPAVLRRTHN